MTKRRRKPLPTETVLDRFDRTCLRCGNTATVAGHLVPHSQPPVGHAATYTNEQINLIALCEPCNHAMGARPAPPWMLDAATVWWQAWIGNLARLHPQRIPGCPQTLADLSADLIRWGAHLEAAQGDPAPIGDFLTPVVAQLRRGEA